MLFRYEKRGYFLKKKYFLFATSLAFLGGISFIDHVAHAKSTIPSTYSIKNSGEKGVQEDPFGIFVPKGTTLYANTKEEILKTTKQDEVYHYINKTTINGKEFYEVERKGEKGYLLSNQAITFHKVIGKRQNVTGIKEYKTYDNFEWKKKGKVKIGGIYFVDDAYEFSNGKKYYSLSHEDKEGNILWDGYVNQNAIQKLKLNKEEKVVQAKEQGTRYSTLFGKKKGTYKKGNTFLTKGYYTLGNGQKFYSLYSENKNGDKYWAGYIPEEQLHILQLTKEVKKVTGTKIDKRYANFFGKEKGEADKGTVYETKGYYSLVNGEKYYSVYREHKDGKRYWAGYINADSVKTLKMKKQVNHVKIKKEYKRYKNFYWQSIGMAKKGDTYIAKGYYTLGNGKKYYSLYDNQNKWHGYVNENAVLFTDESAYYFSQKSPEWNQYYVRNTHSKMYDIGCAPTSLAMAINLMHHDPNYTNPWKVADHMARLGVLTDYGTDASYNVLPRALNQLGLNARYMPSLSDASILGALKNKHMVLMNGMGSNPFTAYGHYILASKISQDGKKVYILDPWNEHNNGWWTVSALRNSGLWRCFEIWL